MPFKSKAQVRKFFALKREGKMDQSTIDQWMKETPNIKKLPEKLKKKASFIRGFLKEATEYQMTSEDKNPEGGLSAAGRKRHNAATGSKLKAGVKGTPTTPEQLRRKGSWASRFYCRTPLPPLKKPSGEPTRLALTANAWSGGGIRLPKTVEDARHNCELGKKWLEKYRSMKGKK